MNKVTPVSNETKLLLAYSNEWWLQAGRGTPLTLAIADIFNKMYKELQKLPFEHCAFEATWVDDAFESCKVTLLFSEKRLLMITMRTDNMFEGGVVYSYFIDRKHIASDVVELKEFVKGFTEYLKMK